MTAYRAAADDLAAELDRSPEDFRLPGPLGIAYAGLGRREEAIAAAKKGVEMMPFSRDSLLGPFRQQELALVYTKVGELDAALAELEIVLGRPSVISVPLLELDPRWEPLREHPGYRRLVEKHR